MSELEDALVWQLRIAKLPTPIREHRFAPPRRWRFDLCWPEQMLAVEVNGGAWINGRHNRATGQRTDNEKHNAAAAGGWCVLRYTGTEEPTRATKASRWISTQCVPVMGASAGPKLWPRLCEGPGRILQN